MRSYLTKEAFTSIQNAIKKGTKIQRDVADQIAVAMKDWALSKGVTHYTPVSYTHLDVYKRQILKRHSFVILNLRFSLDFELLDPSWN